MFPLLFLLGLLLYYSKQTTPTFEHFRNHLTSIGKDRSPDGTASTTTASTAANVGRFLRRLATAATPMPDIVYENYQVCAIATVHYANGSEAVYLGWLGRWWPINETRVKGSMLSTGSSAGAAANSDALDKAEELKESATSAKGKRNFSQAAKAYITAGEAFAASASAAVCFEEAYKCHVQAANGRRHDGKAIACLERAIELFMLCGTTGESRAAGLLCKLAEAEIGRISREEEEQKTGPSATGLRAAQLYRRAADLYERAGDGRHCYTRIHEAETAARYGHYLHSVHAFDAALDEMRHRPSDQLLIPQHLFNGGLCWMALGAWGRLDGHNANPSISYECAVNNEGEKFKKARTSFTARSHLEPWQLRALNAASTSLDIEDIR
ncbi:hypothetical protein BDF19DRAFT_429165 [Syncephalis fuscata]|nr:hypothetical protein BDF19DRAFT_429165 [Syncephalis fuscata]